MTSTPTVRQTLAFLAAWACATALLVAAGLADAQRPAPAPAAAATPAR